MQKPTKINYYNWCGFSNISKVSKCHFNRWIIIATLNLSQNLGRVYWWMDVSVVVRAMRVFVLTCISVSLFVRLPFQTGPHLHIYRFNVLYQCVVSCNFHLYFIFAHSFYAYFYSVLSSQVQIESIIVERTYVHFF